MFRSSNFKSLFRRLSIVYLDPNFILCIHTYHPFREHCNKNEHTDCLFIVLSSTLWSYSLMVFSLADQLSNSGIIMAELPPQVCIPKLAHFGNRFLPLIVDYDMPTLVWFQNWHNMHSLSYTEWLWHVPYLPIVHKVQCIPMLVEYDIPLLD